MSIKLADKDELERRLRAYTLPLERHPCFPDAPLPGGRARHYVPDGMNCLRASTATILNVPYESVPAGAERGGSGLSNAVRPFKLLCEWTEWAEEQGLVPCVHTAVHEPPFDREWWIAMVLRVAGALHFNTYAMHRELVVHSPLANSRDVPTGVWYGFTLDSEYASGFPLRELLAEFASPEEFIFPLAQQAVEHHKGRAA